MHPSPIAVLMAFAFGCVQAGLQNFTVDDTSPDIVYGGTMFQCNAATPCTFDGSTVGQGLFNDSTTFTNDSITFTFTGVAYYATFDLLGTVAVTIDEEEGTTMSTSLGDSTFTHTVSGGPFPSNAQHVLSITPVGGQPMIVGFDSVIYTISVPDKKSHTGAIVGGVIGALAVIVGVLLAILFSRRRQLILRRNQRKSTVLRKMALAGRNHEGPGEVQQGDAENVS